MHDASTEIIEAWFAAHSGDGEFSCEGVTNPRLVIERYAKPGRVIFATKYTPVACGLKALGDRANLSLIGRYGLPSRADLKLIRNVVGDQELLFLGDLDPVDLLIFAWLRARLHPNRITHLGVNDKYLSALGTELSPAFVMGCSVSERQSLAVLRQVFSDLDVVVGRKCAAILDGGHKIEFEAVVSTLEAITKILAPAGDR